jgi:hypothetical protein
MIEEMLHIETLSASVTYEYNIVMQDLANITYTISPQNTT